MTAAWSRRNVEWRYLPYGYCKHALLRSEGPIGHTTSSLCGETPRWHAGTTDWHGTGNQTEYETVAQLPECKRCTRMLVPEEATPT